MHGCAGKRSRGRKFNDGVEFRLVQSSCLHKGCCPLFSFFHLYIKKEATSSPVYNNKISTLMLLSPEELPYHSNLTTIFDDFSSPSLAPFT
jgi:hypothetical protein